MKKDQYLLMDDTVVRAQQGDMDAFTLIYTTYLSKIYFITSQFTVNEEAAKDLTQDIFVIVYQKIKLLQEPKAFHSWIKKITYNQCLNYNRNKYREINFEDNNKIENIIDSHQKEAIDKIEENRTMKAIEVSIKKMREPIKCVGMLRYIEGMSLNEIAVFLDIPVGTVKSRLSAARVILKKDLIKQGITPKAITCVFLFPSLVGKYFSVVLGNASSTSSNYLLSFMGAKEYATLVASVIVPVAIVSSSVILIQEPKEKQIKAQELVIQPVAYKEILPEITNISYDSSWTNQAVHLNVEVSNKNYDAIQVNNHSDLTIYENGNYMVSLIKDEQIIDQQEIVITNIDHYSPNGISERNGNDFIIYISDDLAGVNPDSITLIRNGCKSNAYIYDEINRSLKITTKKEYNDILYIYDYAGNVFEINFK